MRPEHPLRMTTSWPRATSWAVLTLSPRLKVIGEEYVGCPLNASVRLHIPVRKANDRWPRMLLIRRFELDCIGATCPVGMRVHDHAVSTPLDEPVMSALDVVGRMHAGLRLEGHRVLLGSRCGGRDAYCYLACMIGSAGQRGRANTISNAMPINAPTISTSAVAPLRSFSSPGCMGTG